MEERTTLFAIGGVSPGPIRRHVNRAAVALTRMNKAAFRRRDPRRNVTGHETVFPSYGLTWELGLSEDFDTLGLILAQLCDAGTLKIGERPPLMPTDAFLSLPDENELALRNGILRDFQLMINAKQAVRMSTAWQFCRMEEFAFPAALPAPHPGRFAAAPTASIVLGGIPAPVFSGTFSFTRDCTPAGFTSTQEATTWAGKTAVDIIGTLTARLPTAEAAAVITGRFVTSLTVAIQVGEKSFSLVIPSATFQCGSRRLVSANLTDYSLDFMALKTPDEPLATFLLA